MSNPLRDNEQSKKEDSFPLFDSPKNFNSSNKLTSFKKPSSHDETPCTVHTEENSCGTNLHTLVATGHRSSQLSSTSTNATRSKRSPTILRPAMRFVDSDVNRSRTSGFGHARSASHGGFLHKNEAPLSIQKNQGNFLCIFYILSTIK